MLAPAAILFPEIDPVLFEMGPLAVRWYGLAYLAGFILGYVVLRGLAKRGALRLTRDQVSDLVTWVIVGVIVGGRLGWWLVYHRPVPGVDEPWWEPFAIWHGGMSFHGGVAGVAVVLGLWCWRHGASSWNVADGLALVTPIGLFFGRVANFINAELVGRPTDVPWGVIFPGDTVARHPSQLYEAILEGPVLMAILWLSRRRLTRDGQIGALFVIGYGLLRFAVEFTREPDPEIGFIAFGWLTTGQLLSLVYAAIGAGLLAYRSATAHEAKEPRP